MSTAVPPPRESSEWLRRRAWEVAEQAPPLSPEQREHLAALLRRPVVRT